jgi:hypothetical protein
VIKALPLPVSAMLRTPAGSLAVMMIITSLLSSTRALMATVFAPTLLSCRVLRADAGAAGASTSERARHSRCMTISLQIVEKPNSRLDRSPASVVW